MNMKSADPKDAASIFTSRDLAEQWHQGKSHRAEVSGSANAMMMDLANLRAGSRVLDIAAGTGDQTLLAARCVGRTGYVLATDVSASMLEIAAKMVRNVGLTNVDLRLMDAQKIDLDRDSFDAVICRMGLMLFSDPIKALVGMRNVVKPSGKVVALVLSSEEKNPFLGIPLGVARRAAKIASPETGRPGVFALSSPGALEEVYRRAGFADIAVHAASLRRRFRSMDDTLYSLRALSPFFLHDFVTNLSDRGRGMFWQETARQLRQFEQPNGFEIPGEALICVGTK